MTWESLLAYCLAKPGAWQDEPWDGDVVAKIGGKIRKTGLNGPESRTSVREVVLRPDPVGGW